MDCSHPVRHLPYLPFSCQISRSASHDLVFVVSIFATAAAGFLHHFSDGDSGEILHISPHRELNARWSLAMPNCGLKKYRNTVHLWRKPILGTIDVSSKSRLLIRKLMCVFSFNAMAYLYT